MCGLLKMTFWYLERAFAKESRATLETSHLAKQEVAYLRYKVYNQGITTDPSKMKNVKEFFTPSNVKQLQLYLELASYYQRFIPAFSKIAAPLFSLSHKDTEFAWDSQCQNAFDLLKNVLVNAPLLRFANRD